MKVKLKPGERCPLHKSTRCYCHGESIAARNYVIHHGPVTRVADPHHPRGYRELCTPSELRRRKRILVERDPVCWLCGKRFTDYNDIDLEHREPKGMGGARRDDHWDNLGLAHHECNLKKGSQRYETTPPQTEGHEGHEVEVAEGEGSLGLRDEASDRRSLEGAGPADC